MSSEYTDRQAHDERERVTADAAGRILDMYPDEHLRLAAEILATPVAAAELAAHRLHALVHLGFATAKLARPR